MGETRRTAVACDQENPA